MDGLDDLVQEALAPIPGDLVCGADARQDVGPRSLYYRLRDARATARLEDRRAETELDQTGSGSLEPWRQVVGLAREALSTETKDIEIAVWLFEGLVRLAGIEGFVVGARVVAGLIGTFWGRGLNPGPDEDDPWATFATLRGLSGDDRPGTLVQPLRSVPILTLPDGIRVSSWSYNYSRDLSALPPAKRENVRVPNDLPEFRDVERFAAQEGAAQLAAVARLATAAHEAWHELDQVVTATGSPALSTSQVQGALGDIEAIARRYVKNVAPVVAAAAPGDASPGPGLAAGSGPPPAVYRDVAPAAIGALSREALLEQLMAIAAIFRSREPNAPISFTLEEAVRRARMPMTHLFEELIPDDRARTALLISLGLRVDGAYAALPVIDGSARRGEPAVRPQRIEPAPSPPVEPSDDGEEDDLGF